MEEKIPPKISFWTNNRLVCFKVQFSALEGHVWQKCCLWAWHLGPTVLLPRQEIPDLVFLLHRVPFLVGDSRTISPSPPHSPSFSLPPPAPPFLSPFPPLLTSSALDGLMLLHKLLKPLRAPKTAHSEMDQKAKGMEKVKGTEKGTRVSTGICLCRTNITIYQENKRRRVFPFLLHVPLKIAS